MILKYLKYTKPSCIYMLLHVSCYMLCPRKTWMEGVEAAMKTRNLEPDQWRNREKWRLVSGRRRQMLKNQTDR